MLLRLYTLPLARVHAGTLCAQYVPHLQVSYNYYNYEHYKYA